MICNVFDKDTGEYLGYFKAIPIHDEDFCDYCGDCLYCYEEEYCPSGDDHYWVKYIKKEKLEDILNKYDLIKENFVWR